MYYLCNVINNNKLNAAISAIRAIIMKKGTYRNVIFFIEMISYGYYVISSDYKGKRVKVETHDSTLYDWVDDDSNKEKHQDALCGCYELIRQEYNK